LNYLKDKTILVTGGSGTFGRAFTETVLKACHPKAIRIFSRGEVKQLDMANKFKDERLRFFIGDVRDRARVYRAMKGVDICVHSAALKQVPTAEYNPIEAVRTNVDGSVNIIDAAIDCGVKKVIAISSDKAANPVNLYGATKLVMERLMTQANVYTAETKFACVRYGNVVGSRGSVATLIPQMVKDGLITITDEQMTRFWITLDRGVKLVLDALEDMSGGEIYIPKIPSMKVIDLMDAVAPKVKRKVVGIRPGEKLHETLVTSDESRHTKEYKDHYVVEPEFPFWLGKDAPEIKPLPKGVTYTSENNTWWLTKEELRELFK
jgi:UDP-N-acetylglucosamine 4,6-dehydratase (inverting)